MDGRTLGVLGGGQLGSRFPPTVILVSKTDQCSCNPQSHDGGSGSEARRPNRCPGSSGQGKPGG